MRHYHNLLYVSHGITDETQGLKQALSLARDNAAPLKVLVICPEFPKEFPAYQQKYEAGLLEQTAAAVASSREALSLEPEELTIKIDLISNKTPTNKIIQQVLQHGHDLLIKEAEPQDSMSGFKAIDMDLLRKCPCAVWLCRPIEHSADKVQVAVAIDPDSHEAAAEALSQRMLALASSLAKTHNGKLAVLSCWEYEFESYFRGNAWVKLSDDEIAHSVQKAENQHRGALEKLIEASGIGGDYQVHHLRGKADELIPSFTQEQGIDILVMGTLARTGIPGFMIGNTAENIMQKLSCSLLALKPQGFVSPVKAY